MDDKRGVNDLSYLALNGGLRRTASKPVDEALRLRYARRGDLRKDFHVHTQSQPALV